MIDRATTAYWSGRSSRRVAARIGTAVMPCDAPRAVLGASAHWPAAGPRLVICRAFRIAMGYRNPLDLGTEVRTTSSGAGWRTIKRTSLHSSLACRTDSR